VNSEDNIIIMNSEDNIFMNSEVNAYFTKTPSSSIGYSEAFV